MAGTIIIKVDSFKGNEYRDSRYKRLHLDKREREQGRRKIELGGPTQRPIMFIMFGLLFWNLIDPYRG